MEARAAQSPSLESPRVSRHHRVSSPRWRDTRCRGLIQSLRRRGLQVTVVAVPDGESAYADHGDLGPARRREQAEALAVLGVGTDRIIGLALPDREVSHPENTLIDLLIPRLMKALIFSLPGQEVFILTMKHRGRQQRRWRNKLARVSALTSSGHGIAAHQIRSNRYGLKLLLWTQWRSIEKRKPYETSFSIDTSIWRAHSARISAGTYAPALGGICKPMRHQFTCQPQGAEREQPQPQVVSHARCLPKLSG